LQAWGEPGGGSQFRLTLPRTADEPLRGSPIPLEPKDSRRNRGLDDAGLPCGSGEKAATVPAQPTSDQGAAMPARGPIASRLGNAVPKADPTALPGNGARVVPRPASGARRPEDIADVPGAEEPSSEETGQDGESSRHGEASRGR